MPYSITFEIPFLPKSLNQALRSHWSSYAKESNLVGQLIQSRLEIKDLLDMKIKKVAVKIERHSSGSLDRDNKFFTAKHVLDNLVKLGVIENDTEENIVELEVNQIKIKRGEQKKLVVSMREVE